MFRYREYVSLSNSVFDEVLTHDFRFFKDLHGKKPLQGVLLSDQVDLAEATLAN